MYVKQALIMAGGRGTRLGMGTKSYILYKGRILLEYVVESCIRANIANIVVFLPSIDIQDCLDNEKVTRVKYLIASHPEIVWIQYPNDLGLGFRGAPELVRKYMGNSEPFYLLCGQSPQSSVYLNQLGKLYQDNSIVLSGYRYRYEKFASIARVEANRIISFYNVEHTEPREFNVKGNEYISHMPYVWNFDYYNQIMKKDNLKNWVEFYPKDFLYEGGKCFLLENLVKVSEVDFKKDMQSLYDSIDILVRNNYR